MRIPSDVTNLTNAQLASIPEQFRLHTQEVWVEKRGDALMLTPKPRNWDDFFFQQPVVSEDFSVERGQEKPQSRD